MKLTVLSLCAAAASLVSIMAADQKNEIYEMRVYYAPEGKLDDWVESLGGPRAEDEPTDHADERED